MTEVPCSSKHHGHIQPVTGFYHFIVAYGTTGLHNSGYSGLMGFFDRIGFRKKSVTCEYGAFCFASGFTDRDNDRIHARHLASAYSHRAGTVTEDYSVTFNMLHHFTSE